MVSPYQSTVTVQLYNKSFMSGSLQVSHDKKNTTEKHVGNEGFFKKNLFVYVDIYIDRCFLYIISL